MTSRRDVRDRKHLEEEFKQQIDLLQLILNSMSDDVIVADERAAIAAL